MFDRTAIMQHAWRRWRSVRENYAPWQIERGYVDGSFADALRTAWRVAKQEAAREAARSGPNAERIASIHRQIEALHYSGSHMNIMPQWQALKAELTALGA